MASPRATTLHFESSGRPDVVDVRRALAESPAGQEVLYDGYRRLLCVSYHTTAGYLDPDLHERFSGDVDRLKAFLEALTELFPPEAGYEHDRLELRHELSEEQRAQEPLNADSHLAFIGAGFTSCVSYRNRAREPMWFVDLDGTYRDQDDREIRRRRRTTVVGYHDEEVVANLPLAVPVNGSSVESVNLQDGSVGLLERAQELVRTHGVSAGRVVLELEPGEEDAGLTVNEFEPLLVRRDLARMLEDPLRFMTDSGKEFLRSPGQMASRAMDHFRHDASQVLHKMFRAMGMEESLPERAIRKAAGLPRVLRVPREVSLPVLNGGGEGPGEIQQGTYQSPILMQWARTSRGARKVRVRVTRFV